MNRSIRTARQTGTSRKWIAGVAIAIAASTAGSAVASATAGDTPPATVPPALEARLDLLCARVPNLQSRTANLIARLESDASTRGSLAWLSAQVEKARTNGRNDLAVVLENRLAVRTALLDVLELRVANLADLAVFCDGREA